MSRARLARFIRFGLVGCLGFVVDLGVVFVLIQALQLGPVSARIPAWIAAVSTTYFFNLLFTFRTTRSMLVGRWQRWRRYGLYVLSQLGGGVVNVLTYACVVSVFSIPWVIGLVLGTVVGMIFNYLGASAVISRKQPRQLLR